PHRNMGRPRHAQKRGLQVRGLALQRGRKHPLPGTGGVLLSRLGCSTIRHEDAGAVQARGAHDEVRVHARLVQAPPRSSGSSTDWRARLWAAAVLCTAKSPGEAALETAGGDLDPARPPGASRTGAALPGLILKIADRNPTCGR